MKNETKYDPGRFSIVRYEHFWYCAFEVFTVGVVAGALMVTSNLVYLLLLVAVGPVLSYLAILCVLTAIARRDYDRDQFLIEQTLRAERELRQAIKER